MSEQHPSHCPICGFAWDFKTDQIGRLIAVHGIGQCIAKPSLTGPMLRFYRECSVCEKDIVYGNEPPYRQRLFACGERCKKILADRRREQIRLVGRRTYARNKAA